MTPDVTPRASPAANQPVRAGRVSRWAMMLAIAALTLRTLANDDARPRLGQYALLIGGYLLLFTLAGWRPRMRPVLLHLYAAAQCLLILAMLALNPQLDSVTAFFGPVAFQAALLFTSPALWTWVGIFSLLASGSLMVLFGALEGLALSMTTLASIVALPMFMVLHNDTEIERARSQALLSDLEQRQRELKAHAERVEELTTLRERSRLARELHDSVSQSVFSILLTTRSAQLLLRDDPRLARDQLTRLQQLTASALAQLRSLISQLRPSPTRQGE
jgi:signal transduction histidine kinase